MDKQKRQAFTLVELIVVITILAILGTIAFISLQGYSIQARDSTRISDLGSMKTSLELFQLDAGNYPQPTDGVNITYSGATVWNQGSFGDTVYANVGKLDKIPTDPLTEKQYSYSVTSNKNQYQLGGMVEGDDVALGVLTTAHAGTTEAYAYIAGTYNEQMTKSLSGTTCNVLAIPSIITNDTTVTDLQQIVSSGSLVYRGYKNLPASFKGSKFKFNGGFDFAPNNLIAYSDTSSCEPLTDTTSYTARVNLLKGLQDAYSGTVVKEIGEIKNILALSIDVNNLSQQVVNYADNFANNVLGAKIIAGELKVSYADCEAGTLNGYNYGALSHNQAINVTKSGSLANGVQNFGAQANCLNGVLTLTDEASNIVCNSGYVEQAGACVQDICGSTVPANAHSTATSQTVAQTWTQNTTPGVCTFVCDTNYTWNGLSCTANTQNVSCTGLPGNAVWNTASNITQTWNGTIWGPVESGAYNTTASTTECRYQCANNYNWDGDSCEPTGWMAQDLNCDIPDITIGSQIWAGCNSTLGTGVERGKQDNGTNGTVGSCYDYNGNNTATCTIGSTAMSSTTKANTWYTGTNSSGDQEYPAIWGKLYTRTNASSACPSGRHIPSDAEFETLETILNGSNCRNSTLGWLCTGLGWQLHNTKTAGNNITQALKIPLAGFRNTDSLNFYDRAEEADLWSSSLYDVANAYGRHLNSSNSAVLRIVWSKAYAFSVRCLKGNTPNCGTNYTWNGSSCISQWSGDATTGYLFKNTSLVEEYPTSCNNLLTSSTWKNSLPGSPWNGTKFNDGVYWIKPDSNPAFKVYCDMTNDGGGWTLVVGISSSDSSHINSNAVSPSNLVSITGKGKFSDSVINTIKSINDPAFRLQCRSEIGYFKPTCLFNSTIDASGDCSNMSYSYGGGYTGTFTQNLIRGLAAGNMSASNRLIYGTSEVNLSGCDGAVNGWHGDGSLWVK